MKKMEIVKHSQEGKKVAEQSNADLASIIGKVCVLVGVRPESMPQGASIDVLIENIRLTHKNRHMNEINAAFTLYAAGHIQIRKEREHFGQLSALFMNEVLNVYFRSTIRKKHLPVAPVSMQIEQNTKRSEEEIQAYQQKEYEDVLQYIEANNVVPKIAMWAYCYEFAERSGLLEQVDRDQFKQQVFEKLKSKLQKARRKKNYIRINAIENTMSTNKLLQLECRKELIKKHFQNKLV